MTLSMLLFITVFVWGLAPILDKLAVQGTAPYIGNIYRSITIAGIMILVAVFSGELKEISKMPTRNILFYVGSGVLAGGIGVVTYYKAMQLAPSSKVVPIAASYPLVTAVLSVIFLGEKITIERLAGIVLIIVGIYLVK